ncbi:MAG: hypothetical protein IJ191_09695 [Treponema sp.]|nr:hypothetical protein [Treponema sp.]
MKLHTYAFILMFTSGICLNVVPAAAQEATAEIPEESTEQETEAPSSISIMEQRRAILSRTFHRPTSAADFFKQVDVTITAAPLFILNRGNTQKGTPPTITFPIAIGARWPNNYFIAFEPRLSFFLNYYGWDSTDNYAYPVEIEQRTAVSFSLLFVLPMVFTLNITRKSSLDFFADIAFLLRFATSADSTADKTHITKINRWFWQNARFLYIGTGVAWMFEINNSNLKIGPEFRIHFPIGSLATKHGIDGLLLSGGLKIVF